MTRASGLSVKLGLEKDCQNSANPNPDACSLMFLLLFQLKHEGSAESSRFDVVR